MGIYEALVALLAVASQALQSAAKIRSDLSQDAELTPAQEADLDKRIADAKAQLTDAWKIEPDPS